MLKKSESDKPNRRLYKSFTSLLILIFFSLLIARLVLANILATSGQRLETANQRIRVLQEENQKLENEFSKLEAVARIEKLAQGSGFVKAKNVEVLESGKPIANR